MNMKCCMVVLLCVALFFAGCQPSVKTIPEDSVVQVTEAAHRDNPIVCAEFAIERLLAQRPDAIVFDAAPGSEYAQKVAFFFKEPVMNVQFWAVSTDADSEGNLVCNEKECVYSLAEISEDQLLVIHMEFGEVFPIHGISFTDQFGQEEFYYLLLSGEDNVPLLVN